MKVYLSQVNNGLVYDESGKSYQFAVRDVPKVLNRGGYRKCWLIESAPKEAAKALKNVCDKRGWLFIE
jgi:hypothetical protein